MSNAVANQDDGWGSVPTTASGVLRGQAGKLHQDGKYYLMKSTAPFNTDQDLVVSGVTTAWQRWERRKPVELRITYPGAAHPDRDGLGHHDEDEWPVGPDGEKRVDPWKDVRFLYLVNPLTAQEFTIVIDNYHGRDAIGILKDQISNMRTVQPGAVPVIKLSAEKRRTKYGSLVWRPLFVIVDWRVSASKPDEPIKQIEAPAKAGGGGLFDDDIPFAAEWR